ncbi:hypothetical protein PN4B1_23120 [Paenibacillus naphthalenovorans]|uniref:hypothetical protein n=1 Tax=Paenibacillus naphthalenovorans TaxID=162209 RepID=UPI0010B8AC63|nr:hypothetical protein [Paenibacillus naphthalenovorans]GCL72402.1 hypothetical protein PN4B1_23120 [Paenibacillus naphthalenovorans]
MPAVFMQRQHAIRRSRFTSAPHDRIVSAREIQPFSYESALALGLSQTGARRVWPTAARGWEIGRIFTMPSDSEPAMIRKSRASDPMPVIAVLPLEIPAGLRFHERLYLFSRYDKMKAKPDLNAKSEAVS